MSTLELELDELQQYIRRPNLRIQGIEDDARGEDLERKLLAVRNLIHLSKGKTLSAVTDWGVSMVNRNRISHELQSFDSPRREYETPIKGDPERVITPNVALDPKYS